MNVKILFRQATKEIYLYLRNIAAITRHFDLVKLRGSGVHQVEGKGDGGAVTPSVEENIV